MAFTVRKRYFDQDLFFSIYLLGQSGIEQYSDNLK